MSNKVQMKTLTIGETTYEVVDEQARTDIANLGTAGVSGDGGYYIPSAIDNEDGTMEVSFAPSKEGMQDVASTTITLPSGANGKDGTNGKDGADGEDGVSATHSWSGTTLTVTSASGTSSADLKGDKGDAGQNGKDGISATHSWNGTVLTINSAAGTSSADLKGDKGDKGDQGEQGTGVTILGSFESVDALEATRPIGEIGDAYLVNGSLYVWAEESSNWVNVGNIKGPKGDTGNGITKIEKTASNGLEDTYTITLTDGVTVTFTVTNGENGTQGEQGAKGDKGDKGETGATGADGKNGSDGGHYTPSVTDNGNGTMTVSFTASKSGMPAINPVTITLPVPDDGKDGEDGEDGGYYTPSVNTVTANTFKISFTASKSGMPAVGDVTITLPTANDGDDGVGIASVVQTTTSTADGGENIITVTLTNGNKSTFAVKNGSKGNTGAAGEDGKDGTNGKDGANGADGVGIKSIAKTATSGLVDTYTITLTNNATATFTVTNGKNGTNGTNGKDGDPYTLTEADRASIVQDVIVALGGQPLAGYFDEDNNIVLTSDLADGDYTLKLKKGSELYDLCSVTVKTTLNEYTITWNVDGETYTTTVKEGVEPTFDGSTDKAADAQYTYTFAGWDKTVVAATADTTYTAVYNKTVNQYTVTWVVDGKETAETYKYGDTPDFKGSTAKAADDQYTYTFTGWNPAISTVTGDKTYTAQYSKTATEVEPEITTYNVTFSGSNCSINGASTVNEGSAYTAKLTPTGDKNMIYTTTVTMRGDDITETAYDGNDTVSIANVTGDVVITARAIKNLIPLSTDKDGAEFVGAHANGGDGYDYGYRISNSSGSASAQESCYCTGFMPVAGQDTIRIKNIVSPPSNLHANCCFYNSSKARSYSFSFMNQVTPDDNGVYSIRPATYTNSDGVAYFRFSADGFSNRTIATVNEEL